MFLNPVLNKDYQQCEHLFLANIDPDLQLNVLNQMKKPKLVALDTMKHWIVEKKESLLTVLKKVDIFILNDEELLLLSNKQGLIQSALSLLDKGPSVIVVKCGQHGAFVVDNKGLIFSTPAYPVKKVVDTTGAGDSFAGGFLGYLTSKDSIQENDYKLAMAYGVCASSFAVEGFGVQSLHSYNQEKINSRLTYLRKISQF